MTLSKFAIRVRAHDALRVALAVRTIGDQHASINVLFDKNGNPVELFNSDNYCVAFAPIAEENAEWDAEPFRSMRFWATLGRYPAKPTGDAELRVELEADGITLNGRLLIDGFPLGTLTYAGAGEMAGVRKVVPAELERLPVAPPAGFDALHVARVLKAARKPPQRAIPVALPGGGYGFHYQLDGGGEFLMVALRGSDEEEKRFRGILSSVREKVGF